MSDSFLLIWIADGAEPTATDLELMDWKHPPEGPLETMLEVLAYLTTAHWPEGFKPWVRRPDGTVMGPDEVVGFLPE